MLRWYGLVWRRGEGLHEIPSDVQSGMEADKWWKGGGYSDNW
jgi:hypothetical protein